MAPHFAFVSAASTSLQTRSSWTGSRLSTSLQSRPCRSRVTPVLTLNSAGASFRRSLIRQKTLSQPQVSIKPSLLVRAPRALAAAFISKTVVSPARTALALAAHAAKRISYARRRHASKLRMARLGGTFVLAMASFFVTRGAMSGIATISAPTLPTLPTLPPLPFNIALPDRLATILKPFTEAFGVVFLSEFGDKSMFATALMAMKHSPFLVCVGALGALTVMTFIACFLGQLMHLLPTTVTHYSSIALFVFFGLQMILQSRSLPDTPGGVGGERADAEELVAGASMAQVQSPVAILAKVGSLIFVAEWCDRSMLATMALAASSNTVAVIGGATFANIICTGMAVCAATLVASKISERMVALVAGIMFEFFAVFTYFEGPES